MKVHYLFCPLIMKDYQCQCLEVMSFGVPVIVSDVGGIPAVIHNGENGIIVHAGEINQLEKEVSRVLSDMKCRNQMGVNAFNTIQRGFSID